MSIELDQVELMDKHFIKVYYLILITQKFLIWYTFEFLP